MPFIFSGFLSDGSRLVPLEVRISPVVLSKHADYFCTVDAPVLFGKARDIYGADANQARVLAARFVTAALEGREILDQNTKPIDFGQLVNAWAGQ